MLNNLMIKLVNQGSFIYNAADKTGFERGDMGRGKPKVKRIYSVYRIDSKTNLAYCESRDAWGVPHNEALPVHTLEPFGPETR